MLVFCSSTLKPTSTSTESWHEIFKFESLENTLKKTALKYSGSKFNARSLGMKTIPAIVPFIPHFNHTKLIFSVTRFSKGDPMEVNFDLLITRGNDRFLKTYIN